MSADITGTVPIAIARSFDRERSFDRDRAKLQPRSRDASIAITRSADHADRAKRRSRSHEVSRFDDFFLGFVCVLRNECIIYSFGNRENVRKCEQQIENVFSMVFSRTQPNIRKYFSKHFLKCNQTHENIFLSGNTFTRTKRSLKAVHLYIVGFHLI